MHLRCKDPVPLVLGRTRGSMDIPIVLAIRSVVLFCSVDLVGQVGRVSAVGHTRVVRDDAVRHEAVGEQHNGSTDSWSSPLLPVVSPIIDPPSPILPSGNSLCGCVKGGAVTCLCEIEFK